MTTGSRNFLVALGLLAAVFGATGGWFLVAILRLGDARHEAYVERERFERMQADAKLAASGLESSTPDEAAAREELERLRTEVPTLAAELNRRKDALAAEIEKRKAELVANNTSKKASASDRSPGPWNNVGQAQPDTTFQSVLWAIDGGDVGQLSRMIAFDKEAQDEADRFFAALSAEMRATYGDARSLVASMMAAEIDLDAMSMQVASQKQLPDGELLLTVQMSLNHPAAKPKTSILRFRQTAGGWQLLVPAKVIEGYRYLIAAPPTKP